MKTVEGVLFDSLIQAKCISEDNADDHSKASPYNTFHLTVAKMCYRSNWHGQLAQTPVCTHSSTALSSNSS